MSCGCSECNKKYGGIQRPPLSYKAGGKSPKASMSCGQVKKSTRPGKKIMKLYCIDGKKKLVHAGATGYGHNYSAAARKSFKARHKCSTAKPGTAKHLACTELWAGKGGSKKSSPKGRKGKYAPGGPTDPPYTAAASTTGVAMPDPNLALRPEYGPELKQAVQQEREERIRAYKEKEAARNLLNSGDPKFDSINTYRNGEWIVIPPSDPFHPHHQEYLDALIKVDPFKYIQIVNPALATTAATKKYAVGGPYLNINPYNPANESDFDVLYKTGYQGEMDLSGRQQRAISRRQTGRNVGATAYGVLEGLLDTLSFGLTDPLTDKGYEALAGMGRGQSASRRKQSDRYRVGGQGVGATAGAILTGGAGTGSAVATTDWGTLANEGPQGLQTGLNVAGQVAGVALGNPAAGTGGSSANTAGVFTDTGFGNLMNAAASKSSFAGTGTGLENLGSVYAPNTKESIGQFQDFKAANPDATLGDFLQQNPELTDQLLNMLTGGGVNPNLQTQGFKYGGPVSYQPGGPTDPPKTVYKDPGSATPTDVFEVPPLVPSDFEFIPANEVKSGAYDRTKGTPARYFSDPISYEPLPLVNLPEAEVVAERTPYNQLSNSSLLAGVTAAKPWFEAGNYEMGYRTLEERQRDLARGAFISEFTGIPGMMRTVDRLQNDPADLFTFHGGLDALSFIPSTILGSRGLKALGQQTSPLVRNAGNYLTTQTPLRNTYRINPFRFRANPEAFYHRSPNLYNIIDETGGVLQGYGLSQAGREAKAAAAKPSIPGRIFSLNKNPNTRLYFSKGVPLDYGRYNILRRQDFNYELPRFSLEPLRKRYTNRQGYPGPFMVEVQGVPMGRSVKGQAPGRPDMGRGAYATPYEPVPLDKAKFYKEDWLRGYKEIPRPKGEVKPFQSEIDWRNWVKYTEDFDNNPDVVQNLLDIERRTKADGTWMKNPDGSPFQGTPEQFVVQQSNNFKKAFGDSKLVNPDGSPLFLYHGSAKKFDTFDPSKFQLGDAGYSGRGIYTTPSKTTANSYSFSSAKWHSGDIEPTVYQLYGQGNRPIKSSDLIKENQGRSLFNFYRDANFEGKLSPYESLRQYDVAVSDQLPNVQNIRPLHDAREIVFPRNTQVKSAVGNILFDMTNPNIYRGLGPVAGGFAGFRLLQDSQPESLKSGGYTGGLRRWFKEEWKDVKTGEACGRKSAKDSSRPYPYCRPSKKVSSKTPATSKHPKAKSRAKQKTGPSRVKPISQRKRK